MVDEARTIILPIQQEFADAILTGRKPIEFRKTLGDHDPVYVLLYVRELGGVPGAFATGRILRGSPAVVWRLTDGKGINRERFDSYFENQDHAVAIEVRRIERFSPFITDKEIARSGVILPPSFNLVYATDALLHLARGRGTILRELERRIPPSGLDSFGSIELMDFAPSDRESFLSLVTEEIGKWYDNIDAEFAESIVRSHERGNDPHGLLTVRKRIHVFASARARVGFSVATEKRGGSVKFGPTVIQKQFQGHGLAVLGRRRLEELYRTRGSRKAYSTIPDSHREALGYLLKAGYRVEAHLKAHYSRDHGEFVLGKRLISPGKASDSFRPGQEIRGKVEISTETPPEKALSDIVLSHMGVYYGDLNETFIRELCTGREDVPQEEKPRATLFAYAHSDLVGVCSLSGKRGGAVKLAPFVTLDDSRVVDPLFESSEELARREFDARKVYTVAPVANPKCGLILASRGYEIEGLLAEPYSPGIDMAVFAKFPKRSGG